MSTTQLSRSPDLERLREEGYEVFIHRTGYLVVDHVPYVNAEREVRRGRLVSALTLEGDVTGPPQDHVVLWTGEAPCDAEGRPLRLGGGASENQLADDLVVDRTFSSKPADGYPDYYQKMSRYALAISGPAAVLEPGATPMTFEYVEEPGDDSPFEYVDSSATRSQITALMDRLRQSRVVVAGCGGSGSYVLDLVAKTPVRQIDIYDGDRFRQHNAFRSPGAAQKEDFRGGPNKAEYFAAKYRAMHRNVVPRPYALDETTVAELAGADFVFIAIDRGSAKARIISKLEELAIPFVDVGMGISQQDGALGGLVRVTSSISARPMAERARISLADPDPNNDYRANIQIADLNALNAALAVIRWKKDLGFYRDLSSERSAIYVIDQNEIINEDQT
jgi:ThiF family